MAVVLQTVAVSSRGGSSMGSSHGSRKQGGGKGGNGFDPRPLLNSH